MKKYFIAIAAFAIVLVVSCKKERTCSCKYSQTTTTVTAPRSSGQATTNVNTSSGTEEATYSEVKKDEMIRVVGCNSRTETSKDSYTTTVLTPTVLSISGFTFSSFVSNPADVNVTNVNDYTCELK